jgi:succinate dehydrogenase / fumarate reductase flavoprotein subunit
MGGIPTDAHGQVIADAEGNPVVGFYAAGECACVSVHGANRLGTNSLLEASVFGRRSGYAIAEFIKGGAELHPLPGDPGEQSSRRIDRLMDDSVSGKQESLAEIRNEMKAMMTDNCGIFRDADRLQVALNNVKQLQERFQNARVMDKSKRYYRNGSKMRA